MSDPDSEQGYLSLQIGKLSMSIRVTGDRLRKGHIEHILKYLALVKEELPPDEYLPKGPA